MSFLDMMREVLKSESPAVEGKGSFVHAGAIEEGKQFNGMIPRELLPTLAFEESPLPVPPIPTIQPGDRITWQVGAGGKVKEGVVHFLHRCPGEVWAFCTIPDGGWTAVNVKYIRKQ